MVLALVLAAAAASSIPPRPVVPADTYLFRALSSLEVSPDGTTLVYGIERADDKADAFRYELWTMAADGTKPRRVCDEDDDCTRPRFSPDGTKLAWLQSDDEATQIMVARVGAKKGKAVTSGADDVEDYDWSPDGASLVFTRVDPFVFHPAPGAPQPSGSATPDPETLPFVITRTQIQRDGEGFVDNRHSHLYVVPSRGGTARKITSGSSDDASPRWSPRGDVIAFVSNHNTDPDATDDTDIYVVSPKGGAARKLAGNPGPDQSPSWSRRGDRLAFVGSMRPNDYYQITRAMVVPASGGAPVDAWLYPPLDLDPAKKYPMILYVHGGPQEYDGEYFDTGLENQVFPGKGWAVLRVNYRGSTSYGEAFSRALWADWHDREYGDLLAAVDAAVTANPWIDDARLGIGGWSYGGIMTVWTVGHTKRFKVGVPERFEVDYLSCFGTDQWFAQYLSELGSPLENADLYKAKSPGTYVSDIATPLYLIANAEDGNCPPTQAMQLYQRLKLRGIPTELVVYPGEPHTMNVPSHYVDRLYRLVNWFGKELGK